ncbi:MAG: D-hexose-6-phosphate mutarotase [bacterium]|nr:D-hexose-6-phosphate mutarotase [bacterium]
MTTTVTPDALNDRFAIADALRFDVGPGGQARAVVTGPLAAGRVHLQGGHVTHWRPIGSEPVLFLSPNAQFMPGRAIRGGVPVIFPWFGPRRDGGPGPEHGFARTAAWAVESVGREPDGAVTVVLLLEDDADTRAAWPHAFALRHRVTVGTQLAMTLEVENRGGTPFVFEAALHTYLRVGDVGAVTVSGLAGATCVDKNAGLRRHVEDDAPLRITGPTDCMYLGTTAACVVDDPILARRLVVEKHGSASTVVWNPWAAKAAAMADLGADAWRTMLCVETANVADDAVTLAPGAGHAMTARLASRRGP